MKIAIFHNFLDNIGGAEYVDLIMARELGADIYTTNIDKEKIEKMGFSTKNIFSIGSVPTNAPFRQELTYRRFKRLNLGKKYDFYIIAGDWAMAGGIHNKPNLWYVYSPIREIWDLHGYVKKKMVRPAAGLLFDAWVHYHRAANRKNVTHIQNVVAISQNVSSRVQKYLNRDSVVIYPPTETNNYRYEKTGDYWLSVNRLITHKRVDMQLKAFANLPDKKLVVVGSYEQSRHFVRYAKYMQDIKPSNVEIKSWVSNDKLIELYANCRGFITTSHEEDYGMTPVEAMAAGKPVIAPNEGGYKETIIDGQTGILIDDINEEKLASSINKLDVLLDESTIQEQYKQACQAQAKKFDTKIFIQKIKEQIDGVR